MITPAVKRHTASLLHPRLPSLTDKTPPKLLSTPGVLSPTGTCANFASEVPDGLALSGPGCGLLWSTGPQGRTPSHPHPPSCGADTQGTHGART